MRNPFRTGRISTVAVAVLLAALPVSTALGTGDQPHAAGEIQAQWRTVHFQNFEGVFLPEGGLWVVHDYNGEQVGGSAKWAGSPADTGSRGRALRPAYHEALMDDGSRPDLSLRDAWEGQAETWTRWARAPGHDSYWVFHGARFFELLPPPGRLTLDLGCGEGRVSRDLKARGHHVVGVDASPTMIEAAREADPDGEYIIADGSAIPLPDGAADLVVAFMSLHDIDAMSAAVAEAARVLSTGGQFCAAVVHPINSAGRFASDASDSPFVIDGSYYDRRRYSDRVERAGLPMVFHSRHWTMEDYSHALEGSGLRIERVREVTDPGHPRWSRIPLFLHLRARRD